MRKTIYSGAVLGATFMAAALMSTGAALAACTNTEWTNIVPGHALPQVTTRDCGGVSSVKVIGADPQGQTFDFGWSDATQVAPDTLTSVFSDANATNEIRLEIDPGANTMQMSILTTLANGQSANWTADYVVSRTYD